MTSNFIWLLNNDPEKLADMIVGGVHLMELEVGYERCRSCFMNKNDYCGEKDRHQDMECSEIFEEWLKDEYVEPDSWEKIENDAIGLSQVLNESYSCPADIVNEVYSLAIRCEKLAGAEQ